MMKFSNSKLDPPSFSSSSISQNQSLDRRRDNSTLTKKLVVLLLLVAIPLLLFNVGMIQRSLLCHGNSSSSFDYSMTMNAATITAKQVLPTAATHPRPPTPFNCGVVLFYHIPTTGGSSIVHWLLEYARPENGNVTFYSMWGRQWSHQEQEKVRQSFIKGMDAHVSNLGEHEWRAGQIHFADPPLNTSEHLWYKWRSTVEAQGCQMINAIMFRDPLNHAMAEKKVVERRARTTVLDYFLYNDAIGLRNSTNVTKEEKVQRGMELLERHFDVVSVGDHSKFMKDMLNYTGWKYLDMPHKNVYPNTLGFTKKEVEALYKSLVKNGDVDFVDAVKLRYSGYLSYLSGI